MGRHTYQQILDFGGWPNPGKPAYVVSDIPLPRPTDDVHLISRSVYVAQDVFVEVKHERI